MIDDDDYLENKEPRKPGWMTVVYRWLLGIGGVAALVFGGIYAVHSLGGGTTAPQGDIPLIRAAQGPVKVRPKKPGGLEVPHQHLGIYRKNDPGEPVEDLLAPRKPAPAAKIGGAAERARRRCGRPDLPPGPDPACRCRTVSAYGFEARGRKTFRCQTRSVGKSRFRKRCSPAEAGEAGSAGEAGETGEAKETAAAGEAGETAEASETAETGEAGGTAQAGETGEASEAAGAEDCSGRRQGARRRPKTGCKKPGGREGRIVPRSTRRVPDTGQGQEPWARTSAPAPQPARPAEYGGRAGRSGCERHLLPASGRADRKQAIGARPVPDAGKAADQLLHRQRVAFR